MNILHKVVVSRMNRTGLELVLGGTGAVGSAVGDEGGSGRRCVCFHGDDEVGGGTGVPTIAERVKLKRSRAS